MQGRAAVFDDGKTRVAIVGIDALFIRRQTVQAVRAAIEKRCGIEPHSILISASHTHSGGPTGYYLPGEFDDASPLVRSLIHDQTVCANPGYLAKVEQGIIEAVCAADAQRASARCGVAYGSRGQGRVQSPVPDEGGILDDASRPGEPRDRRAGGSRWIPRSACSAPGARRGSCWAASSISHVMPRPVRAGTRPITSAMWRRRSGGSTGDQAVVVFLPGAAGDVTQVDNRSPYQIKQFGEVSARFVGGRVGAEALKALLAMEQGAGPVGTVARAIGSSRSSAADPGGAREPGPRDRQEGPQDGGRHRVDVRQGDRGAGRPRWPASRSWMSRSRRSRSGPRCSSPVPPNTSASSGWTSRRPAFPFTFPVSLANDAIGYVPTEEALGPARRRLRDAAHQLQQPRAGRGPQDRRRARRALTELKPGPVPRPAALPAFRGQPWSYGNLRPELD